MHGPVSKKEDFNSGVVHHGCAYCGVSQQDGASGSMETHLPILQLENRGLARAQVELEPKTPALPGSPLPAAHPTPLILSTTSCWEQLVLLSAVCPFPHLPLPSPFTPSVLVVYMGPSVLLPKTCDPGLANQKMGPLSMGINSERGLRQAGTLRHLSATVAKLILEEMRLLSCLDVTQELLGHLKHHKGRACQRKIHKREKEAADGKMEIPSNPT